MIVVAERGTIWLRWAISDMRRGDGARPTMRSARVPTVAEPEWRQLPRRVRLQVPCDAQDELADLGRIVVGARPVAVVLFRGSLHGTGGPSGQQR